MRNVLFLKGQSEYNAMRNYIDEIEIGFRLAGFNTFILDTYTKSFDFQFEEMVRTISFDIVFTCNAICLEWVEKVPGARTVTYLCDHPSYLRERLCLLDHRAVVFTSDALYEKYLRKYFTNIKHSCYIPLAGSYSKKYIPFSERDTEVVFTGSYKRPEESYEYAINRLDGNLRRFGEFMAKDIIANPSQTIDECLRHALEITEVDVSENEFDELVYEFLPIDAYARYYFRDKMIRTLIENDIPVHVYGHGWDNFSSSHPENLIIEKGNFYVAQKAVAKAKISLNIMPWFKAGFQERIATAMLSGTIAVTDESQYITENFVSGKELVIYSLQHLEELPAKIRNLLDQEGDAQQLASAGWERAKQEMTWPHRTFEMLNYMAAFVDPGLQPMPDEIGCLLQIPYSEEHLNDRIMAEDAIRGIAEILDIVQELQDYDVVEMCDIQYLYSRFVYLYSMLQANFPQLNASQFVDDYITQLKEENAPYGIELLTLACQSLQALFLRPEYQCLQEENKKLKETPSPSAASTGLAQKVLIHKLMQNYEDCPDPAIQEILENIRKRQFISPYNQNFTEKYIQIRKNDLPSVFFDENVGMYYVDWNGKKMYYPKGHSAMSVAGQVNFVNLEQDLQSPHRYLDDGFDVQEGDIVIDAGVAEGNFALDIVEKAKKLYLVECEPEWVEALKETFRPWSDKVVIVEKMLGDKDDETHAAIDSFVTEEEVNFIKMDVEGAELDSLEGASRVLSQSKNVRCAICCYHRKDAEKNIRRFLEKRGFFTTTTDGYLFFKEDIDSWADGELRHGIVRAMKLK